MGIETHLSNKMWQCPEKSHYFGNRTANSQLKAPNEPPPDRLLMDFHRTMAPNHYDHGT
jgi:hypothetical protein